MPIQATLRSLADARAEIIRLNVEVARLEHALTAANILAAVLVPPEVIVSRLEKALSKREQEILIRIMAGDSSDDIAKRFYLSLSTVKSHIGAIYQKTGVHNRGAAAMAGVHLGLETPPEDHADQEGGDEL